MTRSRPPERDKDEQPKSSDIFQTFTLDADELPARIKKRAFQSGGYPYKEKLDRAVYDHDLPLLQIELLKAQAWAMDEHQRIVIVFEGRDASGKGGTIQRFQQHMPPRVTRVVALPKPSVTERGQWYFQRYVEHLPTAGEVVIFDRSWYNRAGVEPINGFCTAEETANFLKEAPAFERMLTRGGIRLFKIFLEVGQEMQLKRLWARRQDPLKQWKLSPIDFEAVHQWQAYSEALERMLHATHIEEAPWTVIFANDKLRTRLAALRHVLHHLPYAGKNHEVACAPDHRIISNGKRFSVPV